MGGEEIRKQWDMEGWKKGRGGEGENRYSNTNTITQLNYDRERDTCLNS